MKKLLFLTICIFTCPIISFAYTFTITKADGSVVENLSSNDVQNNLEFGSTIKINDYTEGEDVGITKNFNYTSESDIPTNRKIIIDINGYAISGLYLQLPLRNNDSVIYDKKITIEIIDSHNSGRLKQLRLANGAFIVQNSKFERLYNSNSSKSKLINCNMLGAIENTLTTNIYGDLIIESGTYELNNVTLYGNLTINGGTFETMQETLFNSYSGSTYTPSITINGGSFKGGTDYMFKNRSITINGGTFDGSRSSQALIYGSSHEVIINGGKIINAKDLYYGYGNLTINNINAELSGRIMYSATSGQYFTMNDGFIKTTTSSQIFYSSFSNF